MSSSSSSNPFDSWPFKEVEENFHRQVREVRDHPMFGKDFGSDVVVFSPEQQRQLLELFLREEAIRFMQDRIRRSRLPLPMDIDLPLRILPAVWRGIYARWCKKLQRWRDHCDVPEGADARDSRSWRPMPDCVEILLQEVLEEDSEERGPSSPKPVGRDKRTTEPQNSADADIEGSVAQSSSADFVIDSADYRQITFRGTKYYPTADQAAVVKLLDQSSHSGVPEMSQRAILQGIGRPTSRLRDVFRSSALWHTLVIRGSRKDLVRLDIKGR